MKKTSFVRNRFILPTRIGLSTIFLIVFLVSAHASLAQSGAYEWTTPKKVVENQEPVSEMSLVADQSGILHLFWNPLGSQEINYARWDGQNWSYPVDVISSIQVNAPSAAIDQQGYLHLIWHDANNKIFYSQAPVDGAGSASVWSAPVAVADALTHAHIAIAPTGTLYIVYPGLNAQGPEMVISEDGGITWSDPVPISPTARPDAAADFTRAAIGEDGTIHVVWSEYQLPLGVPALGSYYAQSNDGGYNWSRPVRLSEENYHQASIAVYKDDVIHVAYNGAAGFSGRYHRFSTDGGKTWSDQVAVIPPGVSGSDGPPQLLVDTNGNVHVASTDGQRVWYSVFGGQSWSDPVYVPSGDETGIPPIGQAIDPNKVRYIERVAMALNQGNRLHLVFWDQKPLTQKLTYWYTSRESSAAPVPLQPFPTKIPTPTPRTITLPTPTLKPTVPAIAGNIIDVVRNKGIMNTGWPILLAIVPVVLLMIGLFVLTMLRINRK